MQAPQITGAEHAHAVFESLLDTRTAGADLGYGPSTTTDTSRTRSLSLSDLFGSRSRGGTQC